MSIAVLLTWFACHYLADFPLQGDYLASMKANIIGAFLKMRNHDNNRYTATTVLSSF